MILVPLPPTGSAIAVTRESDHSTLSWPNPRGSWLRYGVGLFLLFWLGGWAWGIVTMGGQFLRTTAMTPKLILLVWLGGWIVGGGLAIVILAWLFRPSRDERLLMYHDRLVHRPGSMPFDPVSWGADGQRRLMTEVFRGRKTVEIARHRAGTPKLERIGERLRLTIDHGAERTELGEFLREPEKEWLAERLREWRAA